MYFITEKTTETGKKFQAIADRIDAIHKQQKALAEEIGFEKWRKGYWTAYGGFTSLIFNENPNLKFYKEVGYKEYMPKLNTKFGKEIQNKLDSCGKISIQELNECIDFEGNGIYRIGFDKKNDIYFGFNVGEDWDVNIPNDCEEVTASRYKELFNL